MNEKKKKERSVISWLADFAGSKKAEYAVSVIAALLGVACSLFPYLIMIELIGALVNGTAGLDRCINRCLIMGIWWVARYLLHSLSTMISHHATFSVLAEIRMRLMKKLSTLPLGTVQERSSGSYKSIIVERVDSIEVTLAHMLPEMTSNIVGALAVLVLLFCVDWRMALATLIVLPVGGAFFMMMFSGYGPKFRRAVESTKNLNDTAVEYINGIEVIKAFGRAKTSYGKFVAAAKEGADCYIEWMRSCLFGQSAGMAIIPSTLLGILPIGCLLYMNGSLPAETFITVIILSFSVMQPIITAFSYTDDIAQVRTIVGEVTDILEKKDLNRPKSAKVLPKDNSIELKNVRFSYRDEEVLHGVSLKVEAGTVNALVGPSGSGKSTIARLIASLWDVDSGSIELGGADIKELPLSECTRRISFVSQDNYLFDLSVRDNIRMGRKGATDEEVAEAAKKARCHDFITALPDGYDTVIGEGGATVSGGERQRITIARAIMKGAPIIVLDEATANVDPENEKDLVEAIEELTHDKTVVMIAHRLKTVRNADMIFVADGGRIVRQGTHDELIGQDGLYRKFVVERRKAVGWKV